MILHSFSLDLKFENFYLTNKSGMKWWEGKGVVKVTFHCVVSTEASINKHLKNSTVTVKKKKTEQNVKYRIYVQRFLTLFLLLKFKHIFVSNKIDLTNLRISYF
jgi:hypothetical protein